MAAVINQLMKNIVMSRILKIFMLFALVATLGFNAMAQDVITLKNGDEIEAIVQEVGINEVKYKKWANQAGPDYILKKSEIFMIKYINGSKDVFANNIAPVAPMPTASENGYNVYSKDLQDEFYRIGNNDYAMLLFFRENDFSGYLKRFESACSQRTSGSVLLGFGIGFGACGIIMVAANENAGYILMGVGELLTIISIPVSVSAGVRKRVIKNDFAREHFGINNYSYQPKLNFGATSNGIGLTLNF